MSKQFTEQEVRKKIAEYELAPWAMEMLTAFADMLAERESAELTALADPREEALHRVMELLCTSPAVVDTVWHTGTETLHDYCARAIEEGKKRDAHPAPRQSVPDGWFLPASALNEPMVATLEKLIAHANRARWTNAVVRKDAIETTYEADWIKHMQRAAATAAPQPSEYDRRDAEEGVVRVEVSGLTGSGKSAIAGEIEIAMRAIGVPVKWEHGTAEKHMTHADWQDALELYKPKVVIVERNVPRSSPAPENKP